MCMSVTKSCNCVQPKNALGLSLRGWRLESAAFPELKRRGSKLRVLQVECQAQPMPFALSAATMPWLEVEDASELRLELRALRLVSIRHTHIRKIAA
jgi:hypothetical protein